MDGKTASRIVGITYGQLNLWVNKIDGLLSNESVSQGLPRNFTYRDLVLLGVVKYLRKYGFKMDVIGQAIKIISGNWKDNDPENIGMVAIKNSKFVKSSYRISEPGITNRSSIERVNEIFWKKSDDKVLVINHETDTTSEVQDKLLEVFAKLPQTTVVNSATSSNGRFTRYYLSPPEFYDLRRVAYEIQEKTAVPAASE